MAQFYGTVAGNRGEAMRIGTKSSGLAMKACSEQGSVVVLVKHDGKLGKDVFEVTMMPHEGSGDVHRIAKGVVGEARTLDYLVAVQKAERFIAGFEGDELQSGVDELLAQLRRLIPRQAA